MPVDFLIVGQGLAGSLLAWECLCRHYKVIIVDNGAESASKVAAGLINPVTGQRLVKAQNTTLLLNTATACYQRLTDRFNQAFFIEKPMLRLLQTVKVYDQAQKRLQQTEYQAYLSAVYPAYAGLQAAFGFLPQQQTGYLNTRALLSCLRRHFQELGIYRQAQFNYQDVQLQPSLSWQAIQAKSIVFCEGYQAQANPWFGNLPFQLAKGEILTGEMTDISLDAILNYGHWLIPLPDQHFKTGASFDTNTLDTKPSNTAKTALLSSLNSVFKQPPKLNIIEHLAGIRPTTLDKQPFIGQHPAHKNLYIFNGFGAKGSLSIPWYAEHFITALSQNQPLDHSCNIKRYYETHHFT